MSANKAWIIPCALLCISTSACLERELVKLNPCLVQQVEAAIATEGVSRVDLLFVIDNSQSMEAEQALLRSQFPRMLDLLTSGQRPNGETFEPIKDLHVGVVSTDLGAPGTIDSCLPPGDDGKLLTRISTDPALMCDNLTIDQRFLSYTDGGDATQLSRNFQCIATLGTDGCGFEQQLEAMLKALAPDPDKVALPAPDLRFFDAQFELVRGHGADENAGFLRGLDGSEDSIIAVVLVTDEEDCSASKPGFFGDGFTDHAERINVLCDDAEKAGQLYPIRRYVEGLKALRPSHPERVIFAAIVGLPAQLSGGRTEVDFTQANTRDAYYDQVIAASQPEVIPDPAVPGSLKIREVCTNGEFGDAAPAPRIIEVAKGFGENGIVHSICSTDFRPALDAVVDKIADNLPDVCLTFPLVPDATGTVDACDVEWQLPAAPGPGELRSCDDRPYLHPPTDATKQRTQDGRPICVVDQVAVSQAQLMPGQGWYYDDFSKETQRSCAGRPGRIAFTNPPGPGVNVNLSCARETASGAKLSEVKDAPAIGSACVNSAGMADDSRCVVPLESGGSDTRMRCHPSENICILPCVGDLDCPGAWVCDTRPTSLTAGVGPVCVNPTCGDAIE